MLFRFPLTPYSYGWGVLIAGNLQSDYNVTRIAPLTSIKAGAGAYYFAKRSVNAERQSNLQKEREKAAVQAKLREQEQELRDGRRFPSAPQNNGNGLNGDATGNPSKETSATDPASARHASEMERQRVAEKSKYEASEVWRSKKGDRFSGF